MVFYDAETLAAGTSGQVTGDSPPSLSFAVPNFQPLGHHHYHRGPGVG